MHLYQVLLRPIVTEKSTMLQERDKYVFQVALGANKVMVRAAVQKVYDVKVTSVNIIRTPGKVKRMPNIRGVQGRPPRLRRYRRRRATAPGRLAVAKHGNRALTSRCGSADVLEALGVRIERSLDVAEQALNEVGLTFMFAPHFHPAMKRVAQIRRELNRRTIFNLLGPLTNPASAPYQIVGVYSADLTEKLGRALLGLGCQRAWVIHSYDGLDELSTGAPARICEARDKRVKNFDLNPKDLGFEVSSLDRFSGGSAPENADIIRGILEGRIQGPARDVVVLNAAAALHVAGEGEMDEAVTTATTSLDSGAALEKLSQLIEAFSAG